jgi:hypothetical protein
LIDDPYSNALPLDRPVKKIGLIPIVC